MRRTGFSDTGSRSEETSFGRKVYGDFLDVQLMHNACTIHTLRKTVRIEVLTAIAAGEARRLAKTPPEPIGLQTQS